MELREKGNVSPKGAVTITERNLKGEITNRWFLKNCIMDYGRCILPFVLAGANGLPANFPGRKVPTISKIRYGFGRPLGAGANANTNNRGIDYKFKNIIDPDSALSQDIDALEIDSATSIASIYSDVSEGRPELIESIPPYYLRLRSDLHKPYTFQLSDTSPFNPELIRGNVEFDARWVNTSRPADVQEYASGYQKNYPMPPQSAIGNSDYMWMGGNTVSTEDGITEDLQNNIPQFGEFEWAVTFTSELDASARVVETANNAQFVDDDGLTFEINEIGMFADFGKMDLFVTSTNRAYPLNSMFSMRYIPSIIKKRNFSLSVQWTVLF